MKTILSNIFIFITISFFSMQVVKGADLNNALKVGVSRVNITPQNYDELHNVWGTTFNGIHDSLYVKCLMVDNGMTRMAFLVYDLITDPFTEEFCDSLAEINNIPKSNIISCGTHTHNAPLDIVRGEGTALLEKWKFDVKNAAAKAIQDAEKKLAPAKIGYGTGKSYININRDEYTQYGWLLGNNPEGYSDKTVRVVQFKTMDDKPLAVFLNYAVHAVVIGTKNDQITADLPGATSEYIKEELGNDVVVLWTSGAAGDQNPVYMGFDTTYGKELHKNAYKINEALGVMLGEEVLRVCNNMTNFQSNVSIKGEKETLMCPAKENDNNENKKIAIKLNMLKVNNFMFLGVSGEVESLIYKNLMSQFPLANTAMITHTTEAVGYICADSNYSKVTHQVRSTKIKKGYAEKGIIKTFLKMYNSTNLVSN